MKVVLLTEVSDEPEWQWFLIQTGELLSLWSAQTGHMGFFLGLIHAFIGYWIDYPLPLVDPCDFPVRNKINIQCNQMLLWPTQPASCYFMLCFVLFFFNFQPALPQSLISLTVNDHSSGTLRWINFWESPLTSDRETLYMSSDLLHYLKETKLLSSST